MKRLDIAVSDENLLDFALSHITEKNTDEVHGVAHTIVCLYIINTWEKDGKVDFTEEEIDEEYRKLLADYILTKLERNGLVDVSVTEDGEFVYSLSQKGKDKIKNEY